VGLAEPSGDQALKLVVWERGVGLTRACGTGASAAAVALSEVGVVRRSSTIRASLPGGELDIDVAEDRRVTMTGPARRSYNGIVDVESPAA
jgi:diaminopimelate epimerase